MPGLRVEQLVLAGLQGRERDTGCGPGRLTMLTGQGIGATSMDGLLPHMCTEAPHRLPAPSYRYE